MDKDIHIYLDNQATTRVDDRVLSSMLPFFSDYYGNPSSDNHSALAVKKAILKSKNQISNLLNCSPSEVYFTSGATESINLALKGTIELAKNVGKLKIVTTLIEHKSILEVCNYLSTFHGFIIEYLKPNCEGLIEVQDLKDSISDDTFMVCMHHANNEVGTIQPILEIGELCKRKGILFLVDAAQSVGKIQCDVKKLNIDLLALSAHKIYGPKGIGVLYVREKVKMGLNPLILGGGQQDGLRSGTLNVPGIVGLGTACEICFYEMEEEYKRIKSLRDYFINELLKRVPFSCINGSEKDRLPGNINISFIGIPNTVLLQNLRSICISKGSACSSNNHRESHVLKAIFIDNQERINSAVRISIGRFNSLDEINIAILELEKTVNEIKSSYDQY